jgi:hypothetical protein
MAEIAYLVSLPLLHSIVLRGNPIEASQTYRQDVLSLLSNEVTLDDVPWTLMDLDEFANKTGRGGFFPSQSEKLRYWDIKLLTVCECSRKTTQLKHYEARIAPIVCGAT